MNFLYNYKLTIYSLILLGQKWCPISWKIPGTVDEQREMLGLHKDTRKREEYSETAEEAKDQDCAPAAHMELRPTNIYSFLFPSFILSVSPSSSLRCKGRGRRGKVKE